MPITPPDTAVLREAACRAIGEDMGPVDITTQALVDPSRTSRARIFAKETGRLAGLPVAIQVFRELDPALRLTPAAEDGDAMDYGRTILEIEGPSGPILTGERSALNFLQHLSGIATLTRKFVDATTGTKCRILDTRKTIPGLRMLEKYAVVCGGGVNHRIGLYDAFMIKDNHRELMTGPSGLADAVARARSFDPDAELVVEADTLDQVRELASLDIDRILLDNMTTAQMKEAVDIAAGRCELEASGNMSLERVAEVAAAGVDFISVGALTHSAPALDFSLEILTH